MTNDSRNEEPKEGNPLAWLLAGAAALGAAWLGSKMLGGGPNETTEARALRTIRNWDPLQYQTPEQQEELAQAIHFFDMKNRYEHGLPVDENVARVSLLEARLNTRSDVVGSHEVIGEFLAQVSRDVKDTVRQLREKGIDPSATSTGPNKVACPLCRGLLKVEQRNYYGQLVSLPCPRCGATGFVPLGG